MFMDENCTVEKVTTHYISKFENVDTWNIGILQSIYEDNLVNIFTALCVGVNSIFRSFKILKKIKVIGQLELLASIL